MGCVLLCFLVSLFNQIYIRLRRLDAFRGFFLKGMQDVYFFSQLHGQDRAVSVRSWRRAISTTPLPAPLNGFASLGMPPNWMSCISSPISFCASSGKAWMFFREFPIQISGRITGVLRSAKSFFHDI